MSKKHRRKFSRLLYIIVLVFGASFWLAGGYKYFAHFLPADFGEAGNHWAIVKEEPIDIGLPYIPSPDSSLTERFFRLLFIKKAVNKELPKESLVPLSQMSPYLPQAIVAVEDSRFYEHHGFDVGGIARAALVNLETGEIAEGGSTITQQLVKNLFLSSERSFARKAEELLLALDMELFCSKDEILELYLNTIYFGSNYYGVRAAALGYFGKEPQDLNLAESAMLAGLPNAPSLYSPYVDFLLAKKRQFIVLEAMMREGIITEAASADAQIKPIYLAQ